MTCDAGQMIAGRAESERGVIERVSQALDRPVEIGGRRVGKEKMLKPLGDQTPASDERIEQDQRGVVPDKPVSQRGRVSCEDHPGQGWNRKDSFPRGN